MKHLMNIEHIYFELVRSSQKKHEYRLYTEKRRKIRVNDVIILIDNDDQNNLLEVKVMDIKIYRDWPSALIDNYQIDFKGLYNSLDECVEACQKFYDSKDIKRYGIVVYEIEKIPGQ